MRKIQRQLIILIIIVNVIASTISSFLSPAIIRLIPREYLREHWWVAYTIEQTFTPTFTVIISGIIIIFSVRFAMKPVTELVAAMKKVSDGNLEVEIPHFKNGYEFNSLVEGFNNMTKDLKNNEYLRKDFISNVSHEFKTPLSIIQGYSKLLERDDIPQEDRHEYIKTIDSECERLIQLSTNILKLSKLDHNEIGEAPTRFSIDEQIRQTVLRMEDSWSAKRLNLDIELESAEYFGIEGLVSQVWSNLIENACKFCGDGGTIGVTTQVQGNQITVRVSDDGAGMSEEVKARIFEQFYQGDSSHAGIGNGLGLALVKRILEICGGEISVESAPGKGSVFTVKLYNH